jgi:hypothetical protein
MFPEIHLDTGRLGFGASFNLAYGPDGERGIQAGGNSGSVFVLLRDHNVEQRAGLELDEQDNPGVFLFDHKRGTRSSLVLILVDKIRRMEPTGLTVERRFRPFGPESTV